MEPRHMESPASLEEMQQVQLDPESFTTPPEITPAAFLENGYQVQRHRKEIVKNYPYGPN
ncbi:hypothetical protein MGYG_03615 [Nannizzia gypsea CBS 118893]|uniref:Uncharacterized protein n=1 Tax=Arthroderma gypseum (strain ATCC MYA-4604 / CBS 118893) TaxID=535722 RepID=E4USZ6_ARTGP|nr:hypothetical protein MGYG_03615 [Nannizzia gypsea CBS 118893]EFR00609.1 hypothetical protein MGYG_03615 [Nannizzia gypsea CBS 118893]